MDAIIAMIVETVVYLVAYLVDFLKWWRFLSAMLAAGLVFVACCIFGAIPEGYGLLILVGLLALGVFAGITLEWYAKRQRKKAAAAS